MHTRTKTSPETPQVEHKPSSNVRYASGFYAYSMGVGYERQ
jgi:hypothetical protein